jgi:hypothetical protein
MIASIPVLLLASLAAASPDLSVSATLEATKLSPGREYAIVVSVSLPGGIGADKAGVPAPLLQLDVPDSIELSGKHIITYNQLARNDFLQMPYEQLLDSPTKSIGFKLLKKPGAGDTINLNVIAYVSDSSGSNMRFVRKRLSLPIKPGAIATPVDAASSQWGTEDLLQIGMEAPDFRLPKLTRGDATLSQFRGKKNVLITTYRAHW